MPKGMAVLFYLKNNSYDTVNQSVTRMNFIKLY